MSEPGTIHAMNPNLSSIRDPRKNAVGPNVGHTERLICILSGAALAFTGLMRRGPARLGLAAAGGALVARGFTGQCPFYTSLGITSVRDNPGVQHGTLIERAIHIHKPPEELFRFWRNFENLPSIMSHVEAVKVLDDTHSHWVVKAPGGLVEWDAEIINERPGEMIAWRSMAGADVPNAGSVWFRPLADGSGSEVEVTLQYGPPAGSVGSKLARILGEEPGMQVSEDLRRFKEWMEGGELALASERHSSEV